MRLKNSKIAKKLVFDLKNNRRTSAHFRKLFFNSLSLALFGQLKIGSPQRTPTGQKYQNVSWCTKNGRKCAYGLKCKIFVNFEAILGVYDKKYPREKIFCLSDNFKIFVIKPVWFLRMTELTTTSIEIRRLTTY